jgi:SPASM domain peptide maturase of grasp-with-spasm system
MKLAESEMHILMFECCQMTKGYSRALLVDFQRREIEFLDNEIYSIFYEGRNKKETLKTILTLYSDEEKKIVEEYFTYLLDKEYAFLCSPDEIALFPSLNLEWDNPSVITNCLIDLNLNVADLEPYYQAIEQLQNLGCEHLQIRDFYGCNTAVIEKLLNKCTNTIVFKIELLLKYLPAYTLEYFNNLLQKYPIINELILHSAGFSKQIPQETTQIFYITTQVIDKHTHCGVVSPAYFNLSLEHFTESVNFNSCLNRKISIDENGLIKNCPSMKTSFGHISNTTFHDVILNKGFTDLWNVKKDQIETCSVCEFRHICTDCRAFHSTDLNYNKPSKCTYDPINMVWG